jgi:hypothetical protein
MNQFTLLGNWCRGLFHLSIATPPNNNNRERKMATMIMCDYTAYYTSTAIGLVAYIPWIVSGVLWVWYMYSGDGAFSLLSYHIFLTSLPLYPAQFYFNDLRVDPFCDVFTHYAFPNGEIACMASVVVFVIFFRFWYKVPVSGLQWFVLVVLVAILPLVHINMAQLALWKAVVSALYGIVMAAVFCPILWTNQKGFAYLFSIPPFYSWYRESILFRDDQSLNLYRRLRKCNDERAQQSRSASYSSAAFSILSSKLSQLSFLLSLTQKGMGRLRPNRLSTRRRSLGSWFPNDSQRHSKMGRRHCARTACRDCVCTAHVHPTARRAVTFGDLDACRVRVGNHVLSARFHGRADTLSAVASHWPDPR